VGPFDELMAEVGRLVASAEALAALGARLRADVERIVLDPGVEVALDRAVAELHLNLDGVDDRERMIAAMYARAFLRQALDLLEEPGRAPGWSYEDPVILLSLGRASASIATIIAKIAPTLDGLEAALARDGAAFCDVGAGVGALSIAMCRVWPGLRVVGVEPWQPSLRIAEQEISAAGLSDRIDLRPIAVEDLHERDAFDAVWLAGPFLPEAVVPVAIERAHTALRPGGWLLFGAFAAPPGPLAAHLTALRVVRSGGTPLVPGVAVERLKRAGYVDVRAVERSWQAPVEFVVGRRAGA
jgi:precorrin-6B methylase 2